MLTLSKNSGIIPLIDPSMGDNRGLLVKVLYWNPDLKYSNDSPTSLGATLTLGCP